jgi:hypothetical protein
MTGTRQWVIDSRPYRELEMSSRDVGLWDTLLSSIFKSAETQDVTRLEILKRVAGEMTDELYVLGTAVELCCG